MTDNSAPDEAPLVSVVSVFFDRAALVAESIRSLLAQTYLNMEIIVIDDGSRDDTAAELRKFADPRLTVISRENRGFTASINEAVRASRGEYVAIHGSGDLSAPGRIERQARILRERPEVGVVGCLVENDDSFGPGARVYEPPAGLPFHETLLTRNLFTHGEAMFRRRLFDEVGGYREFFRFAQDRDLWLRISRLTDYAIVAELLYRRFKPPGGVSADPEKMMLQAYFSDFAVQCARAVDAGRPDPLARHGPAALFLRPRRADFARRLAWFGARLMMEGDVERGWRVVQQARRERLTRPVATVYALAAMHRRPFLWRRVGRPILAWRSQSFRR